MHILKIDVQNIRGIERQTIDLRLAEERDEPRRRLVILGGNGVGKTTLLHSIAHVFAELSDDRGQYGQYGEEDESGSPRLGAGDVRLTGSRSGASMPTGSIRLHGHVTPDEYQRLADTPGAQKTITVQSTIGGPTDAHTGMVSYTPGESAAHDLMQTLRASLAATRPREPELSSRAFIDELLRFPHAPPCVFLPADRGTLGDIGDASIDRLNDFRSHKRCMEPTRERFQMLPSLLALAHVAPRQNDRQGMVARMWKVLGKYFPELPRPVSVHGLRLLFETDEGLLKLSQLSDGQRALLLLCGELALRNPVNGVVLIDEIEQHLHPRWQRQIIEALPALIPSAQFIVTTQAPYIAASAPDDVVVMGDWKRDGPQPQ